MIRGVSRYAAAVVGAFVLGFAVTFAVPAIATDTIYWDGNMPWNQYKSSASQSYLTGGRMGPEGQYLLNLTTQTVKTSTGSVIASVTGSSGVAADLNHVSQSNSYERCKFKTINGIGIGDVWEICKYRK